MRDQSRIHIFWVAALVVAIGIATSWEPFYESGASAQEQAYSHENLTGTWSGRMMNIPHSVKGIDVTITFTPDQAAVTKGIASFHNLDTNNRATGTIAKVDIKKDIVKFPLVYQGGAPGVDGTTGYYELKFVTPDALEGKSENYQRAGVSSVTPRAAEELRAETDERRRA